MVWKWGSLDFDYGYGVRVLVGGCIYCRASMCTVGKRLSSLDGLYWVTFAESVLLTLNFSFLSSLSFVCGH